MCLAFWISNSLFVQTRSWNRLKAMAERLMKSQTHHLVNLVSSVIKIYGSACLIGFCGGGSTFDHSCFHIQEYSKIWTNFKKPWSPLALWCSACCVQSALHRLSWKCKPWESPRAHQLFQWLSLLHRKILRAALKNRNPDGVRDFWVLARPGKNCACQMLLAMVKTGNISRSEDTVVPCCRKEFNKISFIVTDSLMDVPYPSPYQNDCS